MSKEEIYDAEIAPLMTKIIKVCQVHGLAMVASYDISNEADPTFRCTSYLPDGEGKQIFAEAVRVLKPKSPPTIMLTVEHADGSKTLTAFV